MGASSDNKSLNTNFNDLETFISFQKKNIKPKRPNYSNPLILIHNQYFENSKENNKKYNSFKKYNRKIKYSLSHIIINNFLAIQLESGLIAFSGYNSEIIKIIDIENNYIVKEIKAIKKISCILEFESGMLLTVNENLIYLWDIRGENFDDYICYYKGHKTNINGLIKYNKKMFTSYSADGIIILWNYNAKVIIKKIHAYNCNITCMIKLNNGNLCSSGIDSSIKILDSKSGKCLYELKGHKDIVKSLGQFRDEVILSGSKDGTIKAWKNNQCISTLFIKNIEKIVIIDNNFFAYLSNDNNVKIFDKRKFNCCQELNQTLSSNLIKLKNKNLFFYNKYEIIIWKYK